MSLSCFTASYRNLSYPSHPLGIELMLSAKENWCPSPSLGAYTWCQFLSYLPLLVKWRKKLKLKYVNAKMQQLDNRSRLGALVSSQFVFFFPLWLYLTTFLPKLSFILPVWNRWVQKCSFYASYISDALCRNSQEKLLSDKSCLRKENYDPKQWEFWM